MFDRFEPFLSVNRKLFSRISFFFFFNRRPSLRVHVFTTFSSHSTSGNSSFCDGAPRRLICRCYCSRADDNVWDHLDWWYAGQRPRRVDGKSRSRQRRGRRAKHTDAQNHGGGGGGGGAGRDCYLNKYGGGLTKAERKGSPPYKGT